MESPLEAFGVETLNKAQQSHDWDKPPPSDDYDTGVGPPTHPEFESTSTSASDCSSSSYQTFFTAQSSIEDIPDPTSGALDTIVFDWDLAPMPPPSEEGSIDKIVDPCFHFSIPIPHALITERTSPLTSHIVEMTDTASHYYNAINVAHTEINSVSNLSAERLAEYFCVVSDLKNAVVLRRAAVLAELGRCAEFMSLLLSFYDQDDAMLQEIHPAKVRYTSRHVSRQHARMDYTYVPRTVGIVRHGLSAARKGNVLTPEVSLLWAHVQQYCGTTVLRSLQKATQAAAPGGGALETAV
ncbi:hypothetical protein HYPSUDRAFT_205613 [Hypholoma sublateritium FD-334 SS-4]|uniref:Uncharacterized protein n=1 Tax=Hypholoma sublateritium (strain FD-334 SS-4) TaxID=945553 RepID=A0A0D2PCZ1_HYPSF|nr:hypothetical protein HYPSUDRAFT_205613 [Hypholoma sublateritium FD-334 SS-4]